jgi:hypothetical protein
MMRVAYQPCREAAGSGCDGTPDPAQCCDVILVAALSAGLFAREPPHATGCLRVRASATGEGLRKDSDILYIARASAERNITFVRVCKCAPHTGEHHALRAASKVQHLDCLSLPRRTGTTLHADARISLSHFVGVVARGYVEVRLRAS